VWSGVLATPLWSVFVRADVPGGQKIVVGGMWVLAGVAPVAGAAVLGGLLPFALGLSVAFGGLTATNLADCLTLAFASGAALRLARPATGDRLSHPAAILAAAVVTSVVVDLASQRAVAPGRPFWHELWHHVRVLYWTDDAGTWSQVHDAVRWCAVLSVAVLVERAIRARDGSGRLVTWVWVSGAAVASTFTVIRAAEIVARRETPVFESLWWLVTRSRLSVLNPDPNATGSLFAFLLITATVVAIRRRLWWMLALVVPMLVVPFGLAQSRSAVGAVIAVIGMRALIDRWHARRFIVPAALTLVVIVAAGVFWMANSRSHASPGKALELRAQMVQVGARMAARYPVWGVGLSDYARTSRRFVPPEFEALSRFAPAGENAHNNFLQVLVELGIPAGLAFIWLLAPAAASVWRVAPAPLPIEQRALALGLSALLVTMLLGHPWLVPEVAASCVVGLGLTASYLLPPGERPQAGRRVMWAAVGLYAVSLAWRI
jgi:hypothetical protein